MTPNEALHMCESLMDILPPRDGTERLKLAQKGAELLSRCSPSHGAEACNWATENREIFSIKAIADAIEATSPPPKPPPEHRLDPPMSLSDMRRRMTSVKFSEEFIMRMTLKADENRGRIFREDVQAMRQKAGMPLTKWTTPTQKRPHWLKAEEVQTRAYRGPFWKGDGPETRKDKHDPKETA